MYRILCTSDIKSHFVCLFLPCGCFERVTSPGHHVGIWHHQWEVIWQHQELDTEHRRGTGRQHGCFVDLSLCPVDWNEMYACNDPAPHSHCFLLPASCLQHASADVEKMVLGNKCDVNDKRQVSKERGEKVGLGNVWVLYRYCDVRRLYHLSFWISW